MKQLEVGNVAPDFNSKDENGSPVRLSDFKGQKVVLFFYPKDDTPSCIKEACNIRDNYRLYVKEGIKVLGVSPDSEKKHRKYIEKYNFPFSLLADEDMEVMKNYGVWGPKKFMGRSYIGVHRTTFVIDEKGFIQTVIRKVITKDHTNQIMEALAGI